MARGWTNKNAVHVHSSTSPPPPPPPPMSRLSLSKTASTDGLSSARPSCDAIAPSIARSITRLNPASPAPAVPEKAKRKRKRRRGGRGKRVSGMYRILFAKSSQAWRLRQRAGSYSGKIEKKKKKTGGRRWEHARDPAKTNQRAHKKTQTHTTADAVLLHGRAPRRGGPRTAEVCRWRTIAAPRDQLLANGPV